ncbi:hypothetical protein TCAL_02655, partial [Tigriopus californicus]
EFPKGTSFNRFFFFRLDHSCEIVNGDKPEVVQRGPYTFQSQKERVNFQYHAESDTLSYETITRYKFDPERSCEVCQSTDRMIFINIPLITLIYLGRTHRMFPQHFLHDLNNAIQLKGSHPDSVVTFMQVDKFLFHGWNPPFRWWTPNGGFEGSNACNWLRGTDGFQFAPLITKDQPLWMFHRELCRSIELIPVQGDEMVQGVPVTRYVISENSLLFNTKRNLGFCMEAEAGTNWSACVKASPRSERLDVEECLLDPQYHGYCHKAVWDITSCMDGVPLALSLPHFYQAPTGLRTSVKGLSSSYPPFHETRIKVEPNTGMVVQYQKRLQFNLHLESDTNISQMEHIRKVLLPLFWYEESYEMDDMTLNLIKSDVLAPNKVLQIVQWFVVALGVLLGTLFGISALIFVLGLLFAYVIFPPIIEHEVSKNLDLWDMESEGRKNFEKPPVPVHMNFMVYRVENAKEFLSGEDDKIRFNIKGPYSYLEDRHKENISSQSDDEELIRYGQYKGYSFDREASCDDCNAHEDVTIINAPLLGILHVLDQIPTLGPELKILLNIAITTKEEFRDSLFLTDTVDNIMFHGTRPGSIEWLFSLLDSFSFLDLEALLPPVISTKNGFAVFNGRVNTTHNEFYEVSTGQTDLNQYLEIQRWGPDPQSMDQDLTAQGWWRENGGWKGSNAANTLRGTDGQQVKPFVTEDDRVWLFQTDICRENINVGGIPALRFVLPKRALQANTKFNFGFCMEGELDLLPDEDGDGNWDCVTEDANDEELLDFSACNKTLWNKYRCQDSILDLTTCQGGAPVWMSSPHFINSPSHFREDFDGIAEPNPELHDTILDIEPNTGIVINLHKRVQINIPMLQDDEIDDLKYVQPETLVPIFWLDEGAEIDQENIDKIKSLVVTPVTATVGVQWTLVGLGALGMVACVAFYIPMAMYEYFQMQIQAIFVALTIAMVSECDSKIRRGQACGETSECRPYLVCNNWTNGSKLCKPAKCSV